MIFVLYGGDSQLYHDMKGLHWETVKDILNEYTQSSQTRTWLLLMALVQLQWDARRLIANGQEFKKCNLGEKPNEICIHMTWLKPHLGLVIK